MGDTWEAVSEIITPGNKMDMFSGQCCVEEYIWTNASTYAIRHDLQISNNGITYSQVYTVYVYNTECQDIDTDEVNETHVAMKVI